MQAQHNGLCSFLQQRAVANSVKAGTTPMPVLYAPNYSSSGHNTKPKQCKGTKQAGTKPKAPNRTAPNGTKANGTKPNGTTTGATAAVITRHS
jgi:hypothetical protein